MDRVARQIDVAIHNGIERGVRKAVMVGEATAKTAGFKDSGKTPGLRAAIYGRFEGWSGDWALGYVHAPAKYASYVELGTRPHQIWPMAAHGLKGPLRSGQNRRATGKGPHEHIVGRGQALRWVDGSGEHFARMVHHPGTTGFFFMRYAETVMRRELEKTIQAAIRPL
jgi:hypothetical protein